MVQLLCLLMTLSSFAAHRVEGKWFKKRNYEFRYVTEYDVLHVKRPLKDFPWIEEDCHDQGNRFANWSKSLSYEITYSGGISFGLLGFLDIELSNDRSKTVEFTFQRWVTPTFGIKARHVLHEEFEIWNGNTYVEYRHGDLIERGEKNYPFRLEKMKYGISVVRKNITQCE